MTHLYGLYSKTQEHTNKKHYIYLDKDNKEVLVTEVRNVCEKNEFFDDCLVLGEVIKFVRSVDINSFKLICQ